MITRRRLIWSGAGLLAAVSLFAERASAHHGWEWAEDENFELTGVIVVVKLGNPHGVLTVVADKQDWTVEVGQPWRNARAGLKDSMLVKGVIATFQGHRSKDKKQLVMKAERVIIKGKMYNLYPERT